MRVKKLWNSWEEFLEAATGKSDMNDSSRHSREDDGSDTGWHGSKDWTSGLTLAHEGWKEVRPEVLALTEKIKDDIRPDFKDTFVSYHDVSGGAVDIDRFLIGEPENMIEMLPVKIAKPGRVITVLVSAAFSSAVSQEEIKRRGVAICGLVDALSYLQHGIEIWAEQTITSGDSMLTYGVRVKSTEESLDMDRVMFALAHPSMLRRVIFSIEETENDETRRTFNIGGSYGRPAALQLGEEVNATLELPTMTWSSEEGADPEKWIKEKLGEFGLLND